MQRAPRRPSTRELLDDARGGAPLDPLVRAAAAICCGVPKGLLKNISSSLAVKPVDLGADACVRCLSWARWRARSLALAARLL
ncbi:MAG: hypothetical protein IPL41_06800 [Micropruina sp.]|nr:hypothetical protein [Micropruina sp.]